MKYNATDILNASRIGFEFEFLSKEDPIQIARSLTSTLGTKVIVPMNVDDIKGAKLKYHTPVKVTANLFKLEADFSGGIHMKELVTGPLNFKDAKIILLKTLKWIDDNAWTTERAACQLNVSFDKWKMPIPIDIEHMNTLQFCLRFNEEYVWKRFPNRKDSVYGKSIKHIIPNNIFDVKVAGGKTQFTVAPNKYYSVNLTKVPDGYVEFRFIGGADYQKKRKQIVEIMEHSILSLWKSLQDTELSGNDIYKLDKIMRENKRYLEAYKNPELFKRNFPHINLTINLLNDIETFKTMWDHIKDKLFKFMLSAGTDKMVINYDSDAGVLQVKDADLKFCEVENIEFINCNGFGIFKNCKFYKCMLEKSHVYNSDFVQECTARDCKIEDSNLYKSNTVIDSFIVNKPDKVINCIIEGGVVRSGTKGPHCQVSDSTSIIELDDPKPKPYKGTFGVYKNPDESDYKQARILVPTKKK